MASKRRRGQSRRNRAPALSASGTKPSIPVQSRPKPQPFWKHVLGGSARWVAGLATAAAVAAVTTVVTIVVTQHVEAAPGAVIRHGPPVRIDSVTVLRTAVQAGTYIFQRSLHLSQPELHSLNELQDGTPAYDAWFRSRGGVDPSESHVQLIVEGNAGQPTRITDITMVKSCEAPLTGALFLSPTAGNEGSILINFNLDSPRSVAETPNGKNYFSNYTITLQPGEVQVIQISASTQHYYCQYSLQLTVLVGANKSIETVTNDGKPFQVTAVYGSSRYHALYIGGIATPAGYPAGSFVQENPATNVGE